MPQGTILAAGEEVVGVGPVEFGFPDYKERNGWALPHLDTPTKPPFLALVPPIPRPPLRPTNKLTVQGVCMVQGGWHLVLPKVPEAQRSVAAAQHNQVGLVRMSAHTID